MDKILQDLYDSEINFIVSCFWDGGFCALLGDNINGIKEESDMLNDMDEVAHELKRMAIKHYPKSSFASKYQP